ncbi:hypothetical protein [Streptomyces sp. MBT59]|uniref:hypothetical protein n=1 Tax=Streptomyces sp. MBT59 TaxID=1488390 RepID=UPI001F3DFBA4|nr:hypothetical protein [Streptomyces sp. MBT59]
MEKAPAVQRMAPAITTAETTDDAALIRQTRRSMRRPRPREAVSEAGGGVP